MEDESPGVIEGNPDVTRAVDSIWIFFCFMLVILMQAGFACYEVGAIRAAASSTQILLKNVGDSIVSLAAWCILGHTLAFGTDIGHVFGTTHYFSTENPVGGTSEVEVAVSSLELLYQWAFAATCTTIVSGAVADRIPLKAYIVYAFLTSALLYPLLAHWVWAEDGWASPRGDFQVLGCGVIDFAGSGVVHMCGGGIGHFIAKRVQPRPARFFEPKEYDRASKLKNPTNCRQLNEAGFRQNDPTWMTLGCFLLWFGWYGFNCGSTHEISTTESQNAVGRAAMNTTLGAAFGGIFSVCFELAYHRWSPSYRKNDKKIEDPLYEVGIDVDAGDEAGRPDRERQERDELSAKKIAKIEKYKDEHPGSRDKPGDVPTFVPAWPHRSFKWPFSTHKNVHGAAINGILAGLVGITADDAVSAGAIHMVCGAWGVLNAGFTGMEDARVDAGYPSEDSCSRGEQMLVNTLMTLFIAAYVYLCTWILWGVFRMFKLVDLATEGEVSLKPELESITKLKGDIVSQGLNDNRLKIERERKVDGELDQLESRVDEDVNRLDNIESSLTFTAQDVAALLERVNQLETRGRVEVPSVPRQTMRSTFGRQASSRSARSQTAPVADASRSQAPEPPPTPRASSKSQSNCNIS
eukprot:g10901.t1